MKSGALQGPCSTGGAQSWIGCQSIPVLLLLGVPAVPRRDSLPASLDTGLGVSGWMLLGMQVAPATVAMENTSVAKFPAIFMCPSLSSGGPWWMVSQARLALHGQAAAVAAGDWLCWAQLFLAFCSFSCWIWCEKA